MQNYDEASPSIILAGKALLVKMLITLERRSIFRSNFLYLCILTNGSGYIHDCRNSSDTKRLFSRQPFPVPKSLYTRLSCIKYKSAIYTAAVSYIKRAIYTAAVNQV